MEQGDGNRADPSVSRCEGPIREQSESMQKNQVHVRVIVETKVCLGVRIKTKIDVFTGMTPQDRTEVCSVVCAIDVCLGVKAVEIKVGPCSRANNQGHRRCAILRITTRIEGLRIRSGTDRFEHPFGRHENIQLMRGSVDKKTLEDAIRAHELRRETTKFVDPNARATVKDVAIYQRLVSYFFLHNQKLLYLQMTYWILFYRFCKLLRDLISPITRNIVPEFDPMSKDQTVSTWLGKVEECAKIYNWGDRETIHYALSKLNGVAKIWYQSLPSLMFTWDEWKIKLIKSFAIREDYAELLNEMLSKKVKCGESFEHYYYAKMNLLNRCKIYGRQAVDCLLYGVDDRAVKLGAQAANFTEPEEVLKYFKAVIVGM